ncbi:uncharacterized protein LOC142992220 [Genypterus blacodes]|uniref:uncharacterized protein LOC142992220 n=1 Tax=Genypterus blacodes TaxID=154954 RepID=UPI003F76BB47
MSKINLLRAFVNQRLGVAVDEIFEMFEKILLEYDDEMDRQRRLLRAEEPPDACSATSSSVTVPQMSGQTVSKGLSPKQHDPKDIDPLYIKEEQEEFCISPEEEQLEALEEADLAKFQFAPVSVKSENDEEETQSSPLHPIQSEDDPEVEPLETYADGEDSVVEPALDLDVAGLFKATTDGQFFLSNCFKTESDEFADWNNVSGSQSGLDRLKHNDIVYSKRLPKADKKCSFCGKTFRTPGLLQRHITCHTGEKPFECTTCGKSFRQKGSLQTHMRRHTGEKPFSCLVCGKNFSQNGTLAAHIRIHTGEKPFSCSVCQKSYNEKSRLVRHMRTHTGEKPFTCSQCGKKFSEKGNLNKHKRIHTGEKPYSCSVCEKKFSLQAHVKQHRCPGVKGSQQQQ